MSPGIAPGRQICLIEVYTDRVAGHWGDNLARLCDGATTVGCEATVVGVQGVHPEVRRRLAGTCCRIVDRPHGALARGALAGASLMGMLHRLLRRLAPDSAAPPQARYLQRCLLEVASLRTAHRLSAATPVILTASPALAATAASLSGCPHVRVVHHVWAEPGRLLQRMERRSLHRVAGRALVVCTNGAVEAGIGRRSPGLPTRIRHFTVADRRMYLGADERAPAREQLAIADHEFVVAMVGGWWPYKDVDTVQRALEAMDRPLTLLLAGNPITPSRMEPAVRPGGGRVVARPGWVSEEELRRIYAAANAVLVMRAAGWDEENGAVYDAVRYGVPVVVSDHSPELCRDLVGEPWARIVPAGDADILAKTLVEVMDAPPPRPDPGAPARLGLSTGSERVAELCRFAAEVSS